MTFRHYQENNKINNVLINTNLEIQNPEYTIHWVHNTLTTQYTDYTIHWLYNTLTASKLLNLHSQIEHKSII